MKVLFAVHDEKVSLSIVKKYQREYKEIISYKNVYYFNAILKELQRDKTYDRVVIDEELEEFTSTSYEEKDKFIFNKLDGITDEASNTKGKDIPIILICSDRRTKSEEILVKLFGIGIYNAIIGNDRSTDEVCRLIYSPRSKKEAKLYYRIDSKDVEYDPEHENDVSEEEMQHILSYFKRLGKKEDKYVEAFRKIESQYNSEQLKVIVAILPLHVKSVLESESSEYQKLVSNFGGKIKTTNSTPKSNPTSSKLLNANSNKKKTNKPIVVPSSMEKNVIKKVSIKRPTAIKAPVVEDEEDGFEELEDFKPVMEIPKRRGRPPKKRMEEELENKENLNVEAKKKKRGRPPKNSEEIEEDEFIDILPEFEEKEEYDRIDDSLLRPFHENEYEDEDYDDETSLPGLYDEDDDEIKKEDDMSLPGLYEEDDEDNEEEYEQNEKQSNFLSREIEKEEYSNLDNNDKYEEEIPEIRKSTTRNSWGNEDNSKKAIQNYDSDYDNYDYTNYNNLLSSNRKVIAFVGTSKNGTSFIVNNIAKILSDSGIDTAILDATQNKNSYYIYNKNDDQLRLEAANSINNLINGTPGGMKVSRNLSVYVEVPNEDDSKMYNAGPILENIIQNHSAVLIDCDFNTPTEYFANAQEIYLVQSMDVLTIQPLTAFLKDLKNKDILEQSKIRIIVNKSMRLRGITARQIVGGMSNYNNPEMSIMTELFDRNSIVPIEIPFDIDAYAKYLEGLAECDITVNKYPKDFQNILNKLASVIYPLLPSGRSREKPQRGYQYSNGFSNSVNNTLNNMKKNY